MIDKKERRADIIKAIENLDITPSMYKNADEKYHALADYLSRHTKKKLDMYAQGSFAFGTVIRPFRNDTDGSYDLDFICEVDIDKCDISAEDLRRYIETAIKDGELYGGKLETSDQCFTIQYAEKDGATFSIDIVPAAHEVDEEKNHLRIKSSRPDLIGTAIAIPMMEKGEYAWKTNNPKGLVEWFREINEPYKAYTRTDYRKELFERSAFFDKVEDIPEGMERSSLQRVIQILKRHRDLYYNKIPELKPISAIINILVTDIASGLSPSTEIFTLLEYVLNELNESSVFYDDRIKGEILLENRAVARKNGKWYIANPANPDDNLADEWNKNDEIAKKFFKWISVARKDFIDSMDKPDHEFKAIVESALGQDIIKKTWGQKYGDQKPTPVSVSSKPWRNL